MNAYDQAFMEKFEFLASLAPEEREHFLSVSSYEKFPAGKIAYSEEYPFSGVVFVLSGEFKVFKVSESGREISLYKSKAGEICIISVGRFLGLNKTIPSVSIIATQDSIIAEVPFGDFHYHFSSSPYIQQLVIRNTLDKFYDLIGLIERLTFKSVLERIWEYMLNKTEHGKKPLYTTHFQIASALGTSREVVTRRLHELKDAGLIKIERGKLLILKPDANIANLRINKKKS